MRLLLLSAAIFPVLLLGCDDGGEESSSSARAAKKAVECELTRLAGGKKATVKVTVPIVKGEETFENSEGLTAFSGSYSFTASVNEGSLELTFFENEHVQDEVGHIACGDIPSKKGVFCKDDVFVDKNLGTDSDDDVQVKAFALACKRI